MTHTLYADFHSISHFWHFGSRIQNPVSVSLDTPLPTKGWVFYREKSNSLLEQDLTTCQIKATKLHRLGLNLPPSCFCLLGITSMYHHAQLYPFFYETLCYQFLNLFGDFVRYTVLGSLQRTLQTTEGVILTN